MDKKKDKIEKSENQAMKEQAIDKTATQGEEINHQVKQKREKHQPRDNA